MGSRLNQKFLPKRHGTRKEKPSVSLRVTKWVEVEAEVAANIDASDIAAALGALGGESDTPRAVMMCMGSVATFMRGLSDEVIAQMTAENRARVRDFLREQAARFGD